MALKSTGLLLVYLPSEFSREICIITGIERALDATHLVRRHSDIMADSACRCF